MHPSTDVLVIGCGPGGSCAATFLARRGLRVRVLERETFPRFQIGESLLPCNRDLFDDLGIWPELLASEFPRKYGAQFHIADGSKSHRFVFRNGRFTAFPDVIQVERSRFDHLLMGKARASGAEVLEGWTVRRFTSGTDRVTVEALGPAGEVQSFEARCLIDASGRSNVTGNQEGLREVHPGHRRFAVFSHFTGVQLDEGEARGDTVIVRFRSRWFWIIPVSAGKTSVGLVLEKADIDREGSPDAAFQAAVHESPVMRARMASACAVQPLRTTVDFSYFNRKLTGPRLLRVGDAAGFMDPIFSGGVYVAMWSGRLAAEAAARLLDDEAAGAAILRAYEKRVMRSLRVYWRLVEHYYTPSFMELLMEPRHGLDLPAALVAVLAGDLEPSWRIRWRLELFYLLVRIQSFRPLVPRIATYGDEPSLGGRAAEENSSVQQNRP